MMDYACPVWRAAAHSHIRKLQVLQSKCLRIATNAPWYIGNKQIHDDLGVPYFSDHIRSLTERFDSKLAGVGNPLVEQLPVLAKSIAELFETLMAILHALNHRSRSLR